MIWVNVSHVIVWALCTFLKRPQATWAILPICFHWGSLVRPWRSGKSPWVLGEGPRIRESVDWDWNHNRIAASTSIVGADWPDEWAGLSVTKLKFTLTTLRGRTSPSRGFVLNTFDPSHGFGLRPENQSQSAVLSSTPCPKSLERAGD